MMFLRAKERRHQNLESVRYQMGTEPSTGTCLCQLKGERYTRLAVFKPKGISGQAFRLQNPPQSDVECPQAPLGQRILPPSDIGFSTRPLEGEERRPMPVSERTEQMQNIGCQAQKGCEFFFCGLLLF
ncbi:hypothetical protein Naga_100488g3 [Nannochloropsis gaditana]|uniref:Uncharacterized protein n=1 Tax=Nannochloropsis gaditana TaxID=72520 RepID=W7TDW6_9STRA|nr:hypothetical protein Naga_100488g3 [Nannochloropsis gaditana]